MVRGTHVGTHFGSKSRTQGVRSSHLPLWLRLAVVLPCVFAMVTTGARSSPRLRIIGIDSCPHLPSQTPPAGPSAEEDDPWTTVESPPSPKSAHGSRHHRPSLRTGSCEPTVSAPGEQWGWRANGGGYKSRGSSCVRACINYLFSKRCNMSYQAPGVGVGAGCLLGGSR